MLASLERNEIVSVQPVREYLIAVSKQIHHASPKPLEGRQALLFRPMKMPCMRVCLRTNESGVKPVAVTIEESYLLGP